MDSDDVALAVALAMERLNRADVFSKGRQRKKGEYQQSEERNSFHHAYLQRSSIGSDLQAHEALKLSRSLFLVNSVELEILQNRVFN